jgi:hypothetical protein
VLWRRTLPAIATTAGGYFVVRLVIENFARAHYQAAVLTSGPVTGQRGGGPVGGWILDQGLMLNAHAVNGPVRLPVGCAQADRKASFDCLTKLGYSEFTRYQPAGRYWTFQWIEAGIFTGLAVLLVGLAVFALRRQDA